VLVTGAASGIGEAAVERFASAGARVAGLDAVEATGPAELYIRADVSSQQEVDAAVNLVAETFGAIDVLVAAAGVSLQGTVADGDPAHWNALFAVNVGGLLLCSRAVIPHMRRAGGGAIVALASQLAHVGAPRSAVYAASKGAVVALTRAMAVDHTAEGIRVNCVSPGPTITPMLDRRLASAPDAEAEGRRLAKHQLTGVFVDPREVAETIVFLASGTAPSIVGTNILIDGGYVAA